MVWGEKGVREGTKKEEEGGRRGKKTKEGGTREEEGGSTIGCIYAWRDMLKQAVSGNAATCTLTEAEDQRVGW